MTTPVLQGEIVTDEEYVTDIVASKMLDSVAQLVADAFMYGHLVYRQTSTAQTAALTTPPMPESPAFL